MKQQRMREAKEFEEKVIQINRVSKKTKGGNSIGFSVLMVVGDKKGRVGVGLGKATDVVSSMKKGIKKAKKKMITVPLQGATIPFAITVKKGAGKVMLKPSPIGSGVIAGGPVRAVVEAAGIKDISAKILGSENQASSVYATFEALKQIRNIVEVRGIKLKSIDEVKQEEKDKVEKIEKRAKQVADKQKPKAAAKKPVSKKSIVKKASAKKTVAKKTVKASKKVASKSKTAKQSKKK
jgi:small subunit ribosomal protein S5